MNGCAHVQVHVCSAPAVMFLLSRGALAQPCFVFNTKLALRRDAPYAEDVVLLDAFGFFRCVRICFPFVWTWVRTTLSQKVDVV